jgi:hypothetical protein
MKNEIDKALDYAINEFEKAIDLNISIPSCVCGLLWDSKMFDDEIIEQIAGMGRWKNRLSISKKYKNVIIGNLWWFHGEEIGCAKARLDLLKLIRDGRKEK